MLHSMDNPRIARSVLLTWRSGNTLKTGNYVQFISPLRRFKESFHGGGRRGLGYLGCQLCEQQAFESTEEAKLYLRSSEPQGDEASTRTERTTRGKETNV